MSSTSFHQRLTKLESPNGVAEVTLSEWIEYSYRTKPDPEFVERFARSGLCRLVEAAWEKSAPRLAKLAAPL
jgi:hypothetical protein